MTSRGRLAAAIGVVAMALMVTRPASAALTPIEAKFSWSTSGALLSTFQFRDAINNPAVLKKLSDGLTVTVVMRGYVYPNAGGDPIALSAHTCRVAYDLWNEIYLVTVNNGASKPVPTLAGVYRRCTDLKDEPIAERLTFPSKPSDYYLAIRVEVNPINEEMLKKIQSWVTRPSGASGTIGPSDALFASFVGVFMKKVATADLTLDYATASFPDK